LRIPNAAFFSAFSLLELEIGGMGEWLKPAVLKTAVRGTVPGVRIPLPPLQKKDLLSFGGNQKRAEKALFLTPI
jgi:hypothetical protein